VTGLFGNSRKPPEPGRAARVPGGRRIYCIGDIHGRADLLGELHEQICADAAGFERQKTIVYLGDYIDRGEQSRQVVELLLTRPLRNFETVYLLGNHEQTMLDFLEYPEAVAAWLSYGGREMLASYGIPLAYIPAAADIPPLARELRDALPAAHLDFYANLDVSWCCGDYYFVHAGVRPGAALDRQLKDDQIWIRDEFLLSSRDHGAVVVHGHTITPEPEVRPNRIGIDTGAYASGVLTCLVLEGETRRFLQTGQGG